MVFKGKQKTALLVGLDVGSTSVRVAVGQQTGNTHKKGQVQLIGAVEVAAEGVHKGIVTSIEEVVSSISSALEEAERLVGVPIEYAWVGITGTHILFQGSKGVVAVAKADGEISEEDVGRAVEAAQMIASPLNYDILHVLPRRFSVDGQTGIKDAIGMTGIRLEVDTQIVYGLTTHMKNVTKAVYRTGIDINDLVVSIFATGDAVTTSRQKELGVAVVDIGASTTSVVVYEEGDIIHVSVLPIGSEHITNDIALGLRTSIEVAERLKLEYGHCINSVQSKKQLIDLYDLGAPTSEVVSQHYLIEIISARVAEILEKVNKELMHIKRSGLLPSGVVFTGGGAKIGGLVDFAKDVLRLPAAMGYPLEVESVTDKVHDVGFATAIGLMAWGSKVTSGQLDGKRTRILASASGKFLAQAQKLFRLLIP